MKQLTPAESSTITIRPAYADDELALLRLAALDSTNGVPPMPLLIAEEDGDLRAALSLRNNSAIANPFFRTRHLLELLALHAAATRPAPARPTASRPPRARALATRLG